ncbi:sialidase family protein [Actinacidiphila yanglinensis]|uniref:sialidase family protein n=1 Tax=Actinacidiphila yanglinensis TaxID=310779 RepID=UPI0011B0CA27|nr:sialidase family protein [Actinacidiphila yanglinensis]
MLYVVGRLYGTDADGLVLTRSLDGGRTFEPPRPLDPAAGPQASSPVLAAAGHGSLSVAFTTPASSGGLAVRVLSSTDYGVTFGPAQILAEVEETAPDLSPLSARSGPALTALPGGRGFCAAVTTFDEANGTSRLLTATGSGRGRWEPAVEAAAGTDTVYLQPQIAAGADGRLAVTVYALDLRTHLIEVLLFRTPTGRSVVSALRFLPPVKITSAPFDPLKAVGTGATPWLGNYQGLAAGLHDDVHPVWTDTRSGSAQICTVAPD